MTEDGKLLPPSRKILAMHQAKQVKKGVHAFTAYTLRAIDSEI